MARNPRQRGLDLDDPRYRPLWLRILLVGICIGWGLFELLVGSTGFALIFLAMGGYVAWRFFVTFAPDEEDKT